MPGLQNAHSLEKCHGIFNKLKWSRFLACQMEKEGSTSSTFPCQHHTETNQGGSSSVTKRKKPKYCMGIAAVRRYAHVQTLLALAVDLSAAGQLQYISVRYSQPIYLIDNTILQPNFSQHSIKIKKKVEYNEQNCSNTTDF